MLEPHILDDVPAAWGPLASSHVCATAAHRAEFWRAFAAGLNMDLRFVAVMDGDSFAGGAAALVERRAGMHWLHSMPMLLPGAPLAVVAERESEVDVAAARGFGALQRTLRLVGGEWSLYRPAGAEPDDATLAAVAGTTRWLEASLVELEGGLDAARKRMDRKTRQDVRRAGRRLRFAEEPACLEEAYTLYRRQARGWSGHRPMPIELSRRLLAPTLPDPIARVFTVRDARGILSAALALDHPNETMLWWSGSHAAARHALAFPVLMWSVIEWAAAKGRKRVNLGASAARGPVESFKVTLGARTYRYPVRWLDASHAGPVGRVLANVQEHARRRRSRGSAG